MRPTITFTGYTEWHEEFTVDLKLVAKFNDEEIEVFSPTIAQSKAVDSVLDKNFRILVEEVLTNALKILHDKGEFEMNVSNMLLMDKMSMFNIKQTVGFNMDLYKSCRNTNVLLQGIW